MAPVNPPAHDIGAGYKFLALGLKFAAGTVMFFFGGFFVDRWLGMTPLFTIIGTFVGAGLSFLSVYLQLNEDMRRRKEEQETK